MNVVVFVFFKLELLCPKACLSHSITAQLSETRQSHPFRVCLESIFLVSTRITEEQGFSELLCLIWCIKKRVTCRKFRLSPFSSYLKHRRSSFSTKHSMRERHGFHELQMSSRNRFSPSDKSPRFSPLLRFLFSSSLVFIALIVSNRRPSEVG